MSFHKLDVQVNLIKADFRTTPTSIAVKKNYSICLTQPACIIKVRLSENEFMKSTNLQNSNWTIWRISALASKTRSNQKKSINILFFIYFSKYENAFTFLINLFLKGKGRKYQIFQLLFWVNWQFHKFIPT
jgi:hypothetical protein